jgi:hypothetical protein
MTRNLLRKLKGSSSRRAHLFFSWALVTAQDNHPRKAGKASLAVLLQPTLKACKHTRLQRPPTCRRCHAPDKSIHLLPLTYSDYCQEDKIRRIQEREFIRRHDQGGAEAGSDRGLKPAYKSRAAEGSNLHTSQSCHPLT